MSKEFEILPHTADLKIRVYGKSLQMLFSNAVKGMFESLGPIKSRDAVTVERPIEITSHDLESLLVDYLSEALYLSDVHGEAYLDAMIEEISPTHVKGVLYGVGVDDFESGEIKAVTHHDLKIEERDGGWVAQVLFDL